jgi:uncharacterized protein (TIGR02246 family)
MKRLVLTILACIACDMALGQVDEHADLQRFVDAYTETWNAHDPQELAVFFTEDADMIFGIEPRISGRAEIEQWWSSYFSGIDRRRFLSISIEVTRVLAPNIALLNVSTLTGGIRSESGEALEPRKARGTWVVIRSDYDWKIAALRAHSPVGEARERPGRDN